MKRSRFTEEQIRASAIYFRLGVAIPTLQADDSSNRLLQLWPPSSSRHVCELTDPS